MLWGRSRSTDGDDVPTAKTAPARPPLPTKLYATWTDAGDGGLYLAADENWEGHAELGERKVVGVYTLSGHLDVEAKPTVVEPKKAKR